MKIEELDESKLKVKPTKQNIDDSLGVPEPLPDKNAVIFISGGQGTGKSTFISNLFKAGGENRIYKRVFDTVTYITPEEVFESETDHVFKNHPRVYFDLNQETFDKVINTALETKKEGGNSCLIIDDFSEQLKLKRTEYMLRKLINKHRHLKLTIIISALNQKALAKTLRSLIDIVILFKPKSMIETDNFGEEVFGLNRNDTRQLFDYVFDKQYNFLMYNSRSHKFYKNFTELRIEDSE
jgi:adenosyl cobinamide kinase/adenosyl cobinamide phosphate guanylyltransferase